MQYALIFYDFQLILARMGGRLELTGSGQPLSGIFDAVDVLNP